MGNDASTGRSSKGPRSGKLLVAGWQKRKLPTQLFGVVRHAERADGVFAFWEGGRWSSSEDGRRFPLDPPLSDSGLEQAKSLGAWIDDYAQKKDSKFHVVVCSPYSRCVQTAVGICNRLGPNVKMLIDLSLGEVYGPSVMGEAEPRSHLRAFSVAAEYCRANQINVVRRVVGEAPAWPETLQDARRRFALRFLQYLQRGVTAKRNFLIVTHGDCIGSVMGIMPDQQDVMVEKVDYGAMILGSSQAQHDLRPPAPSSKAMASVLPLSPQEEEMVSGRDEFSHFQDRLQSVEEALEEMESLQELQADKWAMPVDSTTRSDEQSHVAKLTQKAMTGWQCETMNITTRSKKSSKSTKLVKRLNALVESGPFSMQKIEKLLGAIPQTPLGDSTPYSSTPLAANYSGTLTIQSGLSASTYLFGQSEVDSEDFGSGLCSPSEGDGRRVLSSNLDIKTRDRPHPNYRSASAAEKLSMKHYTSPLEGVLELEERENSLRGQQVEPPQKWWPLDAEGSPSSGGSRGSTGSKKKAESRVSLMSSNSLLNMVNEAEEESDIINKPKEESNGKSTVLKCGIGGAGLTLRESPSDANASPAGDRFSTASCKTAEPLEKPKLAAPVGASSLLARRRASLNLKPLGE